ncbi:MAG TPA: hypothetical protein VK859_08865, partial [bacterium]|nr:hypothetical protein [bacterium]
MRKISRKIKLTEASAWGKWVPLYLLFFSPLLTGCPAKSNPAAPVSTPVSVVYLYASDTTAAGNFQTLLNANGYGVTA